MRVLVVHDFAARYGGGENMAFGIRDSLQHRGHRARVFASGAELLPGLTPEADVVTFGTMSPLARVSRVINPIAARDLRRELRTFQPDIVHVRMYLSQLSPLILPVLRRGRGIDFGRSLLHVVNADPICPLGIKTLPDGRECHSRAGVNCRRNGCLHWPGVARTIVQQGLMRRWVDVFDGVYGNSESMASQLRQDGLHCDGWIWNGVPEKPQRTRMSPHPTVLFAGRLVDIKGVDVLIRAWGRVQQNHPAAKLLIAGDGPDRAMLERLAAECSVADRVEFLGHLSQDEMTPLANQAWVQVVPSTWREPFGISCAEAMMRGVAVIATASGGLAEQVVNGETGLLCPPGDDLAWSRAINDLLGDPERCRVFGTAGRRRAMDHFSQSRFIDHWLQIYEQLLSDDSGNNSNGVGKLSRRR